MSRFLLTFLYLLFPLFALAQETPATDAPPPIEDFFYHPQETDPAPTAATAPTEDAAAAEEKAAPATSTHLVQEKIGNELLYVLMLGGMCISSLYIVLYFLKSREGSSRDMVNSAGLILIIFGTIILVLVVSTSEQLTAAIGVLGAIAGYLFRSVQEDGKKPEG